MLVVMNASATEAEIAGVVRVIESLGLRAHTMPGATRTAIGITGNKGAISLQHFENLPGVAEAIRVSKPYKLITLDLKQDRTIVDIDGAKIGNGSLAMIAGPCAIETRPQTFAIAEVVKNSGAKFFRGGAFKPRTSPYAFAGLGEEALKILVEIREKFGLKIVSEALDESGVDLVEKYADMIQIGARNMQNYTLLRRVGRSKLPVLLKRGMAATLEECVCKRLDILANFRSLFGCSVYRHGFRYDSQPGHRSGPDVLARNGYEQSVLLARWRSERVGWLYTFCSCTAQQL